MADHHASDVDAAPPPPSRPAALVIVFPIEVGAQHLYRYVERMRRATSGSCDSVIRYLAARAWYAPPQAIEDALYEQAMSFIGPSVPGRHIVFVAHGRSCLFAQRIYLRIAKGLADAPSPIRLLLLAPACKGYAPPSWLYRRVWSLLGVLWPSRLYLRWLNPWTPYVVGTRIRWLRAFAAGKTPAPAILAVRGLRDPLIAPGALDDIARTTDLVECALPQAGHFDVLDCYSKAYSKVALEQVSQFMFGKAPAGHDRAASEQNTRGTVLLVHGIRDSKLGWPEVLKGVIADGNHWRPEPVSVGYFSALSFCFPFIRRRAARHFIRAYIKCVYDAPSAEIAAVGHSFGAHIIGYSLQQFEDVTLDRVALLSTVQPVHYPWAALLNANRVVSAINIRGRHDWAVGMLSGILAGLPGSEVGVAGCTGFTDYHDRLYEVGPVQRGHAGTVDVHVLKSVARWLSGIVAGECGFEGHPQSRWFEHVVRWSTIAWIPLVCCVSLAVYLGYGIGVACVLCVIAVGMSRW